MTSALSNLLTQTGGKSFKFDAVGATVTGTVVAADVVQKRNFDTNEPEVWSDGKPVEQVRITIATDLRDPADPEDDGHRTVYVKGWGDDLRALRKAIRDAGAADILPGGTFTATYTGDGQLPAGKRGFPPKVKVYTYTAPTATAGLLAEQPAQAPQPQQAAPAAAAPMQPTPEQIAAFQAYQATLAAQQQQQQ